MGIKRCKLGKSQQLRVLEYFVLEVTARSAADLLGMQANTAMLFYRKVRHLIAGELAKTFPEHGEDRGRRELLRRRAQGQARAVGRQARCPCSVSSSAGWQGLYQDDRRCFFQDLAEGAEKQGFTGLRRLYRQLPQLRCPGRVGVQASPRQSLQDLRRCGGHHINGIENFWNQANASAAEIQRHPAQELLSLLKECEFRFNYGSPKQQFAQLKKWANL